MAPILKLNALFKEYRMFDWVNNYGSLSGLTYFWLWNSTSILIQAAKLVQWLVSKGNTQAMAPESELQWTVYTISSSRGLVQSNFLANEIL